LAQRPPCTAALSSQAKLGVLPCGKRRCGQDSGQPTGSKVPAGTLALVRSPQALRYPRGQSALHTSVRHCHLTPSCERLVLTAKRTIDPARMLTESLTPNPELENDLRQNFTFWPLDKRQLLSAEADQAPTSQACQFRTFAARADWKFIRRCSGGPERLLEQAQTSQLTCTREPKSSYAERQLARVDMFCAGAASYQQL